MLRKKIFFVPQPVSFDEKVFRAKKDTLLYQRSRAVLLIAVPSSYLFNQSGGKIHPHHGQRIVRKGVNLRQQSAVNIGASAVLLHGQMLLRNISDEDIIHIPIAGKMSIVAVIVHPPDAAVPPDDAILYIIHVFVGGVGDLFIDGGLNGGKILRMDQSVKGISRKLTKLLRVIAPEQPVGSLVDIDDLLGVIRLVYKEAARHLLRHPFDRGNDLFIRYSIYRKA